MDGGLDCTSDPAFMHESVEGDPVLCQSSGFVCLFAAFASNLPRRTRVPYRLVLLESVWCHMRCHYGNHSLPPQFGGTLTKVEFGDARRWLCSGSVGNGGGVLPVR